VVGALGAWLYSFVNTSSDSTADSQNLAQRASLRPVPTTASHVRLHLSMGNSAAGNKTIPYYLEMAKKHYYLRVFPVECKGGYEVRHDEFQRSLTLLKKRGHNGTEILQRESAFMKGLGRSSMRYDS
jgi:hypothetical protein